ncbi:dihydroneopterin aldolase [Thalassoporum mexicanum PCC 7367]|uniref:dihydroneopterin aldolase n=1 Tax=Thalassoporum mexicanum TaxID=3457544 RepID=UPI00029FFF1D|nr:dihydroneopterin aldolase [Pseudanabaena sp. PCC 7367]AFY69820.1 dihydroneopterin aldolase [Pseudanabaena sp. PCC 7367]
MTNPTTNTKVYINGIRAFGYIGLLPEEKILGQWFEVDLTCWFDFEAAAGNDNINDTLDYRSVIAIVEKLIQTTKYDLIERLAGAIADRVLVDTRIQQVRVLVKKNPPIPNFLGSVAVELERSQPAIALEQDPEQLAQSQNGAAIKEQETVNGKSTKTATKSKKGSKKKS